MSRMKPSPENFMARILSVKTSWEKPGLGERIKREAVHDVNVKVCAPNSIKCGKASVKM